MEQPDHVPLLREPEVEDRRKNPDRRQAPRRRTLRAGRVQWGNGHWAECVVRNLSELGAQLETRGPIPKTFELLIGNQMSYSCCVVWREGNRVGVKFQGPVQLPAVSTTVLSSCRQYSDLCRELASRVRASDRDLVLRMADAWKTIGRRYRSKSRAAASTRT
jgi:hypothetical protein